MLQRTAGCLETCGLLRLLPGTQKTLRSRRRLHSAFWDHGATDLDYSKLWAALIRDPRGSIDEHEETLSQTVAKASAPDFLDFLYPFRALRLIRKYSVWESNIKDTQRVHPCFAKPGQRLYASMAAKALPQPVEGNTGLAHAKVKEDKHTAPKLCELSPDSTTSRFAGSYSFLEFLKGLQISQDYHRYDHVWRQFTTLDQNERRSSISLLLAYLSTSNRRLDVERASSVFEEVRSTAGSDGYYSIIRLCLNLGMLREAIELHYEGSTKFDVPVGADVILAYSLQKRQWQIACDIWINFRQVRQERRSMSYNIWVPSDELHNLAGRVIQLDEFVKWEANKSSGTKYASDSSTLVTFLANRALLALSRAKTLELGKFNALLKILQDAEADTSERYEQIILQLLESGNTKFAIQCYQWYRQRPLKNKISRGILKKVLAVAREHNNVLGMQQVMEDWFRHYSIPYGNMHRRIMRTSAENGDVNTARAILEQYFKPRQGVKTLRNADVIAPLLLAHSRRGEISQLVEIFDGMHEKYGLHPTIKCWNILLSAHGKVHDLEGAFAQFQRLLASSVQPDSYTYSTMMGICITHGDLGQAMEFFQEAESRGVAKSHVMVDCLVLGNIQDERLLDAEKICNDALSMNFEVPLTRMWNYLLTAYAMRRDLENLNRILHRMHDAGVKYDGATYSALMQGLAMARQPDRAKAVLKIMDEAGVRVTGFHYAIIMGGYIGTGELYKVFQINNHMLKRNEKPTTSTRLMMMKASVVEDQVAFDSGSQEDLWKKAEKYFFESYFRPDAHEEVESMSKGMDYEPLDVAHQSSYFSYLIFVMGQRKGFYQSIELYERYVESIPKIRRNDPPLKILSALMAANFQNHDYKSVQQLWDLAFEKAKRRGMPLRVPEPGGNHTILPLHKQALAAHLSLQMRALSEQQEIYQLYKTKEEVEEAGFSLDNKNWNIYVQCLARAGNYKEAFDLCELKLMDGWSGWARVRWKAPIRNRLSIYLRRMRRNKKPIFLRPFYRTFLHLAKAYMDLQDEAVESSTAQDVQEHIETKCRRTLIALNTMEREDREDEQEILRPL